MMAEEDRISNLPDDIIHHILSFLDLKYAMQTSAVSKKWKLVWTLLPQLNLDSYNFSNTSHFNKFVKHVLLHRNNLREVPVLKLRCRGVVTQFTGKSIVNYACFHNVRRMTLVWSAPKLHEFPQFLFSCWALEDLTLAVEDRSSCLARCYISESGWDFPALVKLNLKNFPLDGGKNKRINLFSKCVNLKDLTLHGMNMNGLEELNLCVPQLSNLSLTSCYGYPKVLNVVGHQLQNLTASVESIHVLHCRDLLQKSVEGFDSVKKVNLSWRETHYVSEKKTRLSKLLGVFQKLYNAKFLILDSYIIMVLSSCLDQLLLEPCPFNNLKCVKINTMLGTISGFIAKTTCLISQNHVVVPVQLRDYFLDKCPSATFITDYPQVPEKRPMQNVHDNAEANNLAKSEAETKLPDSIKENRILEAKVQMQDQVTTKHKETFDAEIVMQDRVPHKRSSQQVHDDAKSKKMAKLDAEKQQPLTITEAKEMLDASIKIQDEVISKQEAMFEAKIQMQDQEITKQKAMFEAHIQMLDQVIMKQKALFEAKMQMQDQGNNKHKVMFEDERLMQDQVITKEKAMFEAKIQMQDQVITKQKAMFEAKIQMLDQVITKQKAMFEAKLQMLDQVSTSHKAMLEAKIQMQDNVIAEHKAKIQMIEVGKLDHEKLITHVIKSKIAELKVQVESGNPDYEVIRSIGSGIKSVMELIPESLRAVMEAQFSFEYVQWKSLFLNHIDASQWAKIETELGIINNI